jgi:hypothetical protein
LKKGEFEYLQALVIAQSTLMGALIEEMGRKGLIDSKVVMKNYDKELEGMVKTLMKK